MFWKNKQGWFGQQLKKNIQALEQGDYSRIPWIFCVLTEQHIESKLIAAQSLARVLANLDYDDIVSIDGQMRQTTSMEWSIDWHKKRIEDLFNTKMSVVERRAIIIFASFNPNGFIREKAVMMMKDYDNTLPFIILRQNDWVIQVRQAASKAFNEKMQKLNKGELLLALPFAERLKWCSRGSHGEYTRLFFEKLTSEEHQEELKSGLLSSNVRTRRICINALFESSCTNISMALKHLECEPDPFLRSMLFSKLYLSGTQIDSAARILLRDKFPTNRRLALQYLHEAKSEDIIDISNAFLLDRNASVRVLARNILKEKNNSFDFSSFYIRALENNTVAAIAGLGEVGHTTDTQHIERYISDSRISVVRDALVSLMRLDSEKYKAIILEMLNDKRIGVVKTAQQLILKYQIEDYDYIKKIFVDTPYEYTKIKCATILFSASKWNSLIFMLEAISCDSEIVRRFAYQAIEKWIFSFNRSYVQVSLQQKESIKLLIQNLNELLSDSTKRELLFVLK